jgi:hypothetical protein
MCEEQLEAFGSKEKWGTDRMRGHEVGETGKANSWQERMELNFYFDCYMKSWENFMEKGGDCVIFSVLGI